MMGTAAEKAPRYRAFLLRCWEVPSRQPGQPGTWRFQLQDAETGDKRSFVDLGRLVEFLTDCLDRWGNDCGCIDARVW